jgi:hypothetical protein
MLGRCRRTGRKIAYGRWCGMRGFVKRESESLTGTMYSESFFDVSESLR